MLTLTRGAAAWVAADDGPIRLVAHRTDQDLPGHRRPVIAPGDDAVGVPPAAQRRGGPSDAEVGAPPACGRRIAGGQRAATFGPSRTALGEPQPHVVPDSATDQPGRRDHVQAVQQRESAQKPFGENRIGLRRAEELVEQAAHRPEPPGRRPGGMVEFVIADRGHHPHRVGGLGGGPIHLACQVFVRAVSQRSA